MRKLLVLFVFILAGCANLAENLSDAAATSESIAQVTLQECGNTTPGGPCQPGALIDTETKEQIATELRRANDYLDNANALLREGERSQAQSLLVRVENMLVVLAGILENEGVEL